MRALLNALLYFPSRTIERTPADGGMTYRDLELRTGDGERLHGWWVERRATELGQVLLCHGNAGNIGDRVLHAAVLTAAGFDVLLFDYRGYGRSSGKPSERATYNDARAALSCLLHECHADPDRVIYLGESLGGAVALELALAHPPAGLVLLSAFTSVRDMGRIHYRLLPSRIVPDAYPSLRRIAVLRAALLVLHGEDDAIVPVEHGRALFEAAPEPKRLRTLPGVGHNDIISRAGNVVAEEVASWASTGMRRRGP
ncbi:MAG TPA: alpha/beta fold hydrolase [Solirubrobacteraceae bacterium]|nr:alpha/beta fold hydrolase [Solirubrobacteraceae bacterium]